MTAASPGGKSLSALGLYVISAGLGGVTGAVVGLALASPSGFALWISGLGFVFGAVVGSVSLSAGLLTYRISSATLRRNNSLRRVSVSVIAGLSASATAALILAIAHSYDLFLLVAATFVVSGAIALLAYPAIDQRCKQSAS